MSDQLTAVVTSSAAIHMRSAVNDACQAVGTYWAECRDKDGNLRWRDDAPNTVVTIGKNLILDQALAGAGYTATEYMGLISSLGYTAIALTDTMPSHPGWTEAGTTNAPTFSGNRGACAWAVAAAGAKALSTNPSFAMTGTGTIKGCFLVGGAGATNAVMGTAGVLVSAGLFSGGDRAVLSGDTVTVGYSMAI